MPIDVHASRDDVDDFTVKYGGEHAKITYLPNAMTFEWAQETQRAEASGDMDEMSNLIVEPITDWDLLNNGQKMPVEVASLRILPIALFGLIAQGMVEETQKRGHVIKRKRKSVLDELFGGFGKDDGGSQP